MDVVMVSQSEKTIGNVAQKWRHRLGMETQHAPDMVEVLKKLKILNPKITIVVLADSQLPIVEARAEPQNRTVFLRASVFEGLKRADARSRWILAHELGHVLLNHRGVKYRTTHKNFTITIDKQHEWEANVFAGEFLAPAALISPYRSAREIGQRFNLTHEAARKRLEALGQTRSGKQDVVEPSSATSQLNLFLIDELSRAPSFRASAEGLTSLVNQGYSEDEIFNLVVPRRTLARRRATNDLLTVEETDKALRLMRIASQAQRTFGNVDKAYRWLRKSKRELNGESPIAYLASEAGARVVEEMLYRIEHGIFA